MANPRDPETMRRLIDLSHAIRDGMITYPGLPAPEISDHLTREDSEAGYGPGTTFHIGRISMVANTGTYLDSPFHRFAGGDDLSQLALERLVDLEGLCVDLGDETVLRPEHLEPHDVTGKAILVRTGWDRHWETPAYAVDAPYVSTEATDWLVQAGAVLVGVDSINIDDVTDKSRPAHTGLLAAGIAIIEHMCRLDQLPETGFRLHAAPPRVERFGTFPVRAYAIVDETTPA
jgi:kynurenine formamidase